MSSSSTSFNGLIGAPLTYASPAILERRRRILEETRKLIEEGGITNFSMNILCKRAGVAKRTLYNAFQTREHVIAAAIQEYFLEYLGRVTYSAPRGTLQRSVERIITVGRRNRKIPRYIHAIMEIYFSAEVIPDVWTAMNSVAVDANLEYINALRQRRQLQLWINPETLAYDVVRYEYTTIYDWSRGLIADDLFVPQLVQGYLTLLLGATRGGARDEIEALLRKQHKNGGSMDDFLPGLAKAVD
ncbi:hypothetical protein NT2_24_00030 [Caenibius tardaugens NBRC 16725]|uniref:HTH tetR-type domain-containing protein n=1 Tax=Caenibius tardaugens NBRC 16725 TaxID=1219035 RepID=U3A8R6_9SPHN|nr:TetR/AcrR family transcriptional regulator [Caenibius tardaugens]GAD51158.1 hypothetical protein NT2_24_00030 [Caenibius tardaugens NBRC 16725]